MSKHFLVKLFHAINGHDTTFVHGEGMRTVQLTVDWAVPHYLFHHFFLCSISITFSDEVGALNLRMWFALGVIIAVVSFGLSLVRSTVIGDHVTVFTEESMEVWPSSITALVHIVAHH